MKRPSHKHAPVFLGIEGGGTRTSVRMVAGNGETLVDFQTGPAVLSLLTDRELSWHLRAIADRLPQPPDALGVGLAGARSVADQERLRRVVSKVWPGIPHETTNDLETALAAAPKSVKAMPRVLVLSGTGSCCFGRALDGRTAKVGGRGHLIGDRASACDIGLRALRLVMADFDHHGQLGRLGGALLNALMFTEPEQLIPWSIHAPKTEIASLAVTVFALAKKRDSLAKEILKDSAEMLAEDACACASQIAEAGQPLEFIFNGGVLLKNPGFMRDVSRRIKACWPTARVTPLKVPSVMGALNLAKEAWETATKPSAKSSRFSHSVRSVRWWSFRFAFQIWRCWQLLPRSSVIRVR